MLPVLLMAALAASSGEEDVRFWRPASSGGVSCATWLSSVRQEEAGNEFVAGLWTGLNLAGPNHLVGRTTDREGILGEVRLRCRAEPSEALDAMAYRTYFEMRKAGR